MIKGIKSQNIKPIVRKRIDKFVKQLKEKPEIETKKAIYKVEKVEDRRIIKIKACKIEEVNDEEETDK